MHTKTVSETHKSQVCTHTHTHQPHAYTHSHTHQNCNGDTQVAGIHTRTHTPTTYIHTHTHTPKLFLRHASRKCTHTHTHTNHMYTHTPTHTTTVCQTHRWVCRVRVAYIILYAHMNAMSYTYIIVCAHIINAYDIRKSKYTHTWILDDPRTNFYTHTYMLYIYIHNSIRTHKH